MIGIILLTLGLLSPAFAQRPGGGAPAGNRQGMNIGHFYGKVVDESGHGVGYATVQLFAMRFDTATRAPKMEMIAGQITEENGDFSLEGLPVRGEFTLKVSFMGFADTEQKVSFGLPAGGQAGGRPQNQNARPSGGMNFDIDLGNIALVTDAKVLDEVVVTGEAGAAVLALDKKVFRVDKNPMAAGGTAEDALRNIPSLSIDLDGNLTLRNASPQVFIDGRPSTLTLDQIAADAIESVEIITNPSAKYDASGGQAGIVNIVLKKDRRIGYNGGVRAGVDSRGGINLGGDINAREGKVNGFLSAFYNQRRGWSESETTRDNFSSVPETSFLQTTEGDQTGYFTMFRGGLDWFMDNRNTLTFSGSFGRGSFGHDDESLIHVDTLYPDAPTFSELLRTTTNDRNFRRSGGSVLFKHLFPKSGKEWTADVNVNGVRFSGSGDYLNEPLAGGGTESLQRQESDNKSTFLTAQTDYVDPLTDKIKLEAGLRAAVRRNQNENRNFINDGNGDWVPLPTFGDSYEFNDDVYAAYATVSYQLPKWGYQLGLRAESSFYTGELPDADTSFTNNYPLSLFPSAFATYKLNEMDNIQASYTRRVNRPNFFQLMPFTDFTDPLNLRRGNPNLQPEFTHSFEVSYQNIFPKGHNLLVSAYFKQTNNLITAYQFSEYVPELDREVLINSYANSNSSQAFGAEFTLKNTFFKIVELTSNVNVWASRVDASNVETDLVDERISWFVKENLSVKLPAGFTLQVSGEYQSPAAFSPSSGGGRFGGHWGGSLSTAQGYRLENWFVDMALRKDLLKRRASLTLSFQDVFRSRIRGTYTESDFFIQETWGRRNPQFVRLNFSYRFGKMDASLFKRKNTNMSNEGMDMMQ